MPNDNYANEPNQSRSEDIIQSILDNTEYDEEARSRIEYLLIELKNAIEGGGGGGSVASYAPLTEKPKIDNHTLQAGNNTSSDLGLQTKLTFDSAPTESSTNPVTSGGVYTALAVKADESDVYDKLSVDTALSNKADKSTTYTKSEVDEALSSKQNTISDLATIRSGAAAGATAVQPISGKGLSTNDYTTAEKTKLAGIAEGAEVNVQSDWTQTTTTADDYIKNKPTLGTAAAKNATDAYNATGTDVTTGKAVAAALATLPEPMIFKGSLGTGGTITTLPTASSSNKGYTYKVITAGTYASQSAKVGDTFISDGSAWVLIPSGDEPSGTVTNVAVADGGGLTVSGSPVTSSGTITVGHSNSVTAKTSSSVKKFTYDANGHVTGSSELSTAESNALASGIDSTKVEQIETNKNNILSNTLNGGGINKFQVTATTTTINGITFTVNADKTITATGSIADSSQNAICTLGAYTAVSGDVLSEGFAEANSKAYIYARGGSTSLTNATYKEILANDIGVERNYACVITSGTVGQVNITFKPMICNSDSYAKSGVYQPYAMSNAELTAKEQQNKNNILYNTDNGVKNILNFSNYVVTGDTSISVTDRGGIISVSGTPSQNTFISVLNITFSDEVPMILSGCPQNSDAMLLLRLTNDTIVAIDEGEGAEFTPNRNVSYKVVIRLVANTAYDLTFKPMIRNAVISDSTYQPYAMSNAELTAAIRALQAQLANQ